MTWEDVLAEVIGAFLSGSLNFRIGHYSITVRSATGTPARFTFAVAIAAAEALFAGEPGTITIGDVTVVIAYIVAPAGESNATPVSSELAASIAAAVHVLPTPAAASVAAAAAVASVAIAPTSAVRGKVTTEPPPRVGHTEP